MARKPSRAAEAAPQPPTEGLRGREWRRWLKAPDPDLLEELYVPGLSSAVRYDRCCAYFSSSVLAAAARGFGKLIERLEEMGAQAPRPAIRLVVNEELAAEDVRALTETGDLTALEAKLKQRFKSPTDALEKQRLQMLAWLAKRRLLEVRVGVMRRCVGLLHAKFGIMTDARGDALVFRGSGNESAPALLSNYEDLEITGSWDDPAAFQHYTDEFAKLWSDTHPDVHTVTLPEAIRLQLIKLAQKEPPTVEPRAAEGMDRAAMIWQFIAEAPYLPDGAPACDTTAMVDLWPHQGHVIAETANAWPDGRLLCDEVGLGKTIEAIVVLRRLMAGRGVRRALILVPASLVQQWQAELREKGGLLVPRYDLSNRLTWPDGRQRTVSSLAEALREDCLLMSRETARLADNREMLLLAEPWDLVVLDESHAARRREQKEGQFNSGTLLLDLLRELQLRAKARGFLLLSATPMQTHPWEPWDLLSVLGEGGRWLPDFSAVSNYYDAIAFVEAGDCTPYLAQRAARVLAADGRVDGPTWKPGLNTRDVDALANEFVFAGSRAEDIARWLRLNSPLARRMHRNTRRTLHEYYEQNLLPAPPPKRAIDDVVFDFTDAREREVYERITKYIDTRYELLEEEQAGKGFVMTIYRRRAASCPYALQRSLERRREGLQRVADRRAYEPEVEEEEQFDERDELPDYRGPISKALPTNPRDARTELQEVEGILQDLDALVGRDSKLDAFLTELRKITDDGRAVLIFSQYTDTVHYIRDFLVGLYGERLGCYTGDGGEVRVGGAWKKVSKGAIVDALSTGKLQALICNDAASEGLNLQAAGAVINYDLPWNPSKVEQRIGRVDRIGQELPLVKVVNLFLVDSVDERVYRLLRERCGLFEHFVGSMQPVLARAQKMLWGEEPLDTDALKEEAQRVDQDVLSRETYAVEGRAKAPSKTAPPLTRSDLEDALRSLPGASDIEVKEKDGRFRARGHGLKSTIVSARNTALEHDEGIVPLAPHAEPVRRIVQILSRSGARYPLVVGSHQDGSFRRTVTAWIGGQRSIRVETLPQLRKLLDGWNGEAPDPERWVAAKRAADRDARRQVADMRAQADRRQREALNAQVAAARERLLKELARFLYCLDANADLNKTWYEQLQRTGGTAERLKQAFKRLAGEWPDWPDDIRTDAAEFVADLTQNRKDARLLGTELDAALQDPRWKAAAVPASDVERSGA